MLKEKLYGFMVLLIFCICSLFARPGQAADKFKVLVVMSYEETFAWTGDIKAGTDSVLESDCEIKYFYMDTKTNLADGPEKAKKAYMLYQAFQPDGVIAADDNAQSMFVLPYLKDKVRTPVIFCGVNSEPERYGYPASNVSGVLERYHIAETIAFGQQLVPSVKTIGYITKDSSTGRADMEQIRKEKDHYTAKSAAFNLPKTLKEALAMTKVMKTQCDALFMETMEGITDENGRPLTDKEIMPIVAKAFGKPTFTTTLSYLKHGLLCALIQTGQEQGETAAKLLLKAMQGTPVSEIPITRNHKGKPIINVTVMNALGIRPRPGVLHIAELVTTEK
ncbi:ABC transporter substrate-binding protein [Desulfonema magnum]|uniref:ABC transporter, substrate-binding protein n=1 Tax=Desulfonema magnum TaxID=45655 RepID=A0A975GNB7_9BACT|nr:ABC transporter substrate binding protein [Desulfonema magnum]QTA86713.1 putative ABC transporter, substrate-binding protein [Desulfonema magnum]